MVMAQKFFQNEYLARKRKPVFVTIDGKEFVIPYAYLKQHADPQVAQDNFMDDFFDSQQKDLSFYRKKDIEPKEIFWTDGKIKYTFFVPYALKDKNLSNSEIVSAVFKKAEKKYKKAAALAEQLQNAYPNSQISYGISAQDIKSMQKQYRAYLWNKTKDKTKYGALLVGNFVRKGVKLGAEKIASLTPQKVKRLFKRYALATIFGGATIGTGYTVYSAMNEKKQADEFEQAITEVEKKSDTLKIVSNQKDLQITPSAIKNSSTKKLSVVEHNQQLFENNINEIKAVLCFMENFSPKAFQDGNGFWTIGYGTTYLIDENGKGNRTISPIKENMVMTMQEANIQKERYLKFRILPQIIKDIKVLLNKEDLIATTTFMYVIGPQAFKNSGYLEAMNQGICGEKLSRYMLGFAKDKGVIKRNWFAAQIMSGKLKPVDFLNLRAEGCYTLDVEDCCYMKNSAVRRDKDGLGVFCSQKTSENIAKAKQKRYSVIGKCKIVREILPADVVNAVEKNAQKQNVNLAMHQQANTR